VYLCDIAEQLGVHPRTVRRALRRGGAPPRRGGRRGSRLEPYRPVVDQLLAEGGGNTVVILRELQAKGYTGGVSILRDYVRPKRALRAGGRAAGRRGGRRGAGPPGGSGTGGPSPRTRRGSPPRCTPRGAR